MSRSRTGPLRLGHWIDGECVFEGPADGDGRSAEGPWVVARAGERELRLAAQAARGSSWPDLSLRERIEHGEAWVADLLRHGAWVDDLEQRFGLGRSAGERWLELLDSLSLELDGEPASASERRWLERHPGPTFCWRAPGGGRSRSQQRRPVADERPALVLTAWQGLFLGPLEDALNELVQHARPVVLAWAPELPELGEALGRSAAALLPRGAFALLQRPPLEDLEAALEAGAFANLAGRLGVGGQRKRLRSAFCAAADPAPGTPSLCGLGGSGVLADEALGDALDEGDPAGAESWGRAMARGAFGREAALSGQACLGTPACLGVPERSFAAFTRGLLDELEAMASEQPPVPPLDAAMLREFREVVVAALDEGATLIHGEVRGRRAVWGPVVLTNVEQRMSICAYGGCVPVLALRRVP